MQSEVWLQSNRRPAWLLVAALAGVATAAGVAGLFAYGGYARAAWWGLAAGVLAVLAAVVHWARQPRLACRDGKLRVYLRLGSPLEVPLEVVECFFFGQGPAVAHPGVPGTGEREAANVIIRLAEAAEEWKRRDVQPALGSWCDGYVTIRGMWCEPIDEDLLRSLNARLTALKKR